MSEPLNLIKFYFVVLAIIIGILGFMFSEKDSELKKIKKECIERGYAVYDCDNSGKAIFKFKEKNND